MFPHAASRAATPWHYKAIALLMLAWSLLTCTDYMMNLLMGDAYAAMNNMTPEQEAYFAQVPFWVETAHAVSVWGGLAGAIAMLLRRRAAAGLLMLSVAGTVLYTFYSWFLSSGIAAMGALWFMPGVVAVLTLAVALYCRRAGRLGLLAS